MAEAAVMFLLKNVQQLLVEQMGLISGAEKELNLLQSDLELMNAFLIDYGNHHEKEQVFMHFEKQIREAVYEAEDACDACLTQKASGGMLGAKDLDLARRVKELRVELKSIFDQAVKTLTALSIPSGSSSNRPARSDYKRLKKTQTLLLREDNVVGFKDHEETIIKYLSEERVELDVISIVGMPGLGKTTLARKIYQNKRIQFKFPTLIWVNVSPELNVREVFLTILKKCTREDMSNENDMELIQLVRSHLQKMKFLLFVDDVWTTEDWERIEAVLPKENNFGKVLITSRHVRVAEKTNPKRKPHSLRFLTSDESWELLRLEVFNKNNPCPEELEEIGMQISKQCRGVPLAVVVIGGFLFDECDDRRHFWKNVSDSVGNSSRDVLRRIENIISLSYNKLHHDLRDCFLYLGMFPMGYEIPAWKLKRLWIAEGFIKHDQERSLEEVAEDNLNELVARNLVMVEKINANGDVKSCRVHNIIRDFCQNEAASGNKNLFQEVKKTRHGVFDPKIAEIVKQRRLCIHSNVVEFIRNKPKGPRVRSFVCFSKEAIIVPKDNNRSIPNASDLLRVIDITPLKFNKFPPNLTELIHLKYIALSVTKIKALPCGISKLWNLQTFKIDTARESVIKVDISKMMQLRHLKTKAAICLEEVRDEGGGENLQTLSILSANCCGEELFSRVSNLKNLGIRGDLTKLVDGSYLGILEHLEKLKLVHNVLPVIKALPHVLDMHSFPPNLRMLTLSSTFLDWTEMAKLGSLQNLEVLKLKEMAFKGTLWEAQGHGFLQLQTLHIAYTDLETWTASSGQPFPKLGNLILKNCERLQEIPHLVGKGESLELVEIECVSRTLVKSANKIMKEKLQAQAGDVRPLRGGFKLKHSPGDALLQPSKSACPDEVWVGPSYPRKFWT